MTTATATQNDRTKTNESHPIFFGTAPKGKGWTWRQTDDNRKDNLGHHDG